MKNWKSITEDSQKYYEVEEDCLSSEIIYAEETSAEEMAELLWSNAAFPGEFVVPAEMQAKIIEEAKTVFSSIISSPAVHVSKGRQSLLILAVVLIAEGFDADRNETQMWNYIFKVLGFREDNIYGTSFQSIYKKITAMLKEVAANHGRYLTEEGHKHYNTVFCHALAPNWSAENLLNTIYEFYAENLDCEYISKDNSYRILVSNICSRWEDSEKRGSEAIKVHYESISSSFRTLFRSRPNYMAALCDALAMKIDAVLSQGTEDLSDNNRWDLVVANWYNRQTEEEKEQLKKKRSGNVISCVVTDIRNIRPCYCLNEGRDVLVSIPRIRLPDVTNDTEIVLYQDGTEVFRDTIPVVGNYLCWTTSAYSLNICHIPGVDLKKPLNFSVAILCHGRELYNSGKRLYRNFITFSQNGRERKKPAKSDGFTFLFTSEVASVVIDDPEENYYMLSSPGQLYNLSLASAERVLVNGRNILGNVDSSAVAVTCYIAERRLEGIKAMWGPNEAEIFRTQPSLIIEFVNGALPKNYFVYLDGRKLQLGTMPSRDGKIIVYLPREQGVFHMVRVQHFGKNTSEYSLRYVCFTGCELRFDKDFYTSKDSAGKAEFVFGHGIWTQKFSLIEKQPEAEIIGPEGIQLRVRIPLLDVRFGDKDAFSLPESIWHEDVPLDSFLHVKTPAGLGVGVFYGAREIPRNKAANSFEIGNFIRSGHTDPGSSQPLWIRIWKNGRKLQDRPLTWILLKESFDIPPLQCEGRRLLWRPEGYHGKKTPDFTIKVQDGQKVLFQTDGLGTDEEFICETFNGEDGYYSYAVSHKNDNIFSIEDDDIIFRGEISVGDAVRSRFRNRLIRLTKAYFFDYNTAKDDSCEIHIRDGYITEICFAGDTPRGPSYTGTMCRRDTATGDLFPLEVRKGCERINPVTVILLDNGRASVSNADGLSLRFNTERNLLTHHIKLFYDENDLPLGEELNEPTEYEYTVHKL